MLRRPPRSTRTDTPFPYSTLFRSDWNPENDIWSLYHVDKDFSEADDLAAAKPAKLAEMKSLFDRAARDNHVYPIGAGLIPLLYPDQRIGTTATDRKSVV